MNRAQFPPIYHTPQSNSPSSVQSPQEHPAASADAGKFPELTAAGPASATSNFSSAHSRNDWKSKIENVKHTDGTATVRSGSASSRTTWTADKRSWCTRTARGPNVNPNAAPGPIPATTPLVVRQDQNGVQWIAFEYSRDRVKMEYTIRCDVESVNVDELPQEFKTENCVYPRACCSKDQYKGNRLLYETECNTVGWALAQLNACLRGKRGLIQRAVDSWRNSNQDPRLRSRRVRRMAKISNRKAVQAAQHGTHMPGSGGPGAAGVPNPAGAGLAAGPGPRQPGMSMGGQQLHHHHEHPGGGAPGSNEDVSGMFNHQM
ncbi:hypothetical protein H2199_002794 [Coniosporium tulheliwenetii]|uniref:Uncharacterized protein n=1 Tax=Coniosporium tulheliwenetii TaxID=3383036 RepID=A0ACC2ZEM2_9PEZI|nr:hypothetical protein H2199_002794 [Cladosporium sp. JES 115]